MRDHNEPFEVVTPERELEAALKALSPSTGCVDPVAAAFAAGQKFGRGQLRTWRAAAAVAVIVGMSGWLVPAQRGGGRGDPVARHDTSVSTPTADTLVVFQLRADTPPVLPVHSVLLLQRAVADGGVNALPVRIPPTPPAPGTLHEEELF